MAVPPSVHAPSVMTDRLSDQSGAALLLVSIRSEQTVPEPTMAFFPPFPSLSSIHPLTAPQELPSFLFPPQTVDLNM